MEAQIGHIMILRQYFRSSWKSGNEWEWKWLQKQNHAAGSGGQIARHLTIASWPSGLSNGNFELP